MAADTITCYALRDRRTGLFLRQGGHPLKMKEAFSPMHKVRADYVRAHTPPDVQKEPDETYETFRERQIEHMEKRHDLWRIAEDSPLLDPFRHYECVKITLPTVINGVTVVPYKEEVFDNF